MKRLIEANYRIKTSKDLTDQQYEEVCKFLDESLAADVATMKQDQSTIDMFDKQED